MACQPHILPLQPLPLALRPLSFLPEVLELEVLEVREVLEVQEVQEILEILEAVLVLVLEHLQPAQALALPAEVLMLASLRLPLLQPFIPALLLVQARPRKQLSLPTRAAPFL